MLNNFKTIEEQLHSFFVSPLKYLSHIYDLQNYSLPQHLTFLPNLTLYLSGAEIIVVFYTDNKDYYLLSFSIKTYTPSPLKRIIFTKGKQTFPFAEITSVISNSRNNNQLCLYSRKTNAMAVIDDFSMMLESKNQSITFQCETLSKKDIAISIKYSPFDNYIGILLSNNTLILFSVELMSQVFSYTIQSGNSVKDFSFFESNSNNWSSFSLLLLNANGEIDVVCPFFPLDFSISNQHIASLKEINAKYSESLITKDLNNQIVEEIENSMKDIQKANHVVANDYLQNFNNKLISKKITIVNKASNVKCEQYKKIFVLNEKSPFFILRVSENDSIDVLVLSGEIMPIRELKQSSAENKSVMKLYLIERIILNNMNKREFFVTRQNEDTFIMLSDSNVYKIEISYIRTLEKLYEEKDEEIELGYFKSDVSQILNAGDKNKFYVVPMIMMNNIMIINKENSMVKFLTVVKSSSMKRRKQYENKDINNNELSREIRDILIRFKKDFEACEEEKIIERKKKEKKEEEIEEDNKKEFSFGGADPPIDTTKSNIMIKKNLFEPKNIKPKVDTKKEEPKKENKEMKTAVQEEKKFISNPFTKGQNNTLKGFEPSLPKTTNTDEQPTAHLNPFNPTKNESTKISNPFTTQASQSNSQCSFNPFTPTRQNENPIEKQNVQNPFVSNATNPFSKTQPSTSQNPFDINSYINPKKEQSNSIFMNNPFPPANPPNFNHQDKPSSPLSNVLINSKPIEQFPFQHQESKILKSIEDEYENKRKFLSIKKEIYMEKISLLEHYGKEMNMIIKKLRSKSKICLNNIQSVSSIEKEVISKREKIKAKIKSIETTLKHIKLSEANKKINIENSNIHEMLSSQLKQLQSKLSEIEDNYSTIQQQYEEILNNDSTSLFSDLSIPISSIGTELYSKYKYMVQSKIALLNEIERNYNKL